MASAKGGPDFESLYATSTDTDVDAPSPSKGDDTNEAPSFGTEDYAQDSLKAKFQLPDLPPPQSLSSNSSATGSNPDPTSTTIHDIPFRAQPAHRHHTWAKTFHSRPELYIRPQTIEEVQKAVILARRSKRRIVLTGAGHSPSDLTCTSAWMMNLGDMASVLDVKKDTLEKGGAGTVLLQAGIYLRDINEKMASHGLTMPNLGSINAQSIAGAISTGTHGSSMRHGLLAQSIRSLRLVTGDGRALWCSAQEKPDLFRAALVSLGAIGIITEVEFQLTASTNIEWHQSLETLDTVLSNWEKTLWTQAEYVRCWWMPYMKHVIVWKADKTTKPKRAPKPSFYGGALGFHSYRIMLWAAYYIPSLLPTIEWFVFGMQYRFSPGPVTDAVEEQKDGLLMDCLFSQFVNEWAIPLHKGPEALTRLDKWIHGDEEGSEIPFSAKNLYVHCPIEVRVSDGAQSNVDNSACAVRGFMDPSMPDEPTLYLNATLYRAFGLDPPCKERYYEAFEWLMKELGGRPHWAKNFQEVSKDDISKMYGDNLTKFLKVRHEVDPDGMFVGPWHRRNLLGEGDVPLLLEEQALGTSPNKSEGGLKFTGEINARAQTMSPFGSLQSVRSEESFDLLEDDEVAHLLKKESM